MASKGLHDKYSNYHYCIVRECKNTSIKNPEKLWIKVPSDETMRNTWLQPLQLAKRDPVTLSSGTAVYFCEDHFNLESDMENYTQYKIMGSVKRIRMKPNCVPTRFSCQMERKRKHLVTNDEDVVKKRVYPIEQSSLSISSELLMEDAVPSCSSVEDKICDKIMQAEQCNPQFRDKAVQAEPEHQHASCQVVPNYDHKVTQVSIMKHYRSKKVQFSATLKDAISSPIKSTSHQSTTTSPNKSTFRSKLSTRRLVFSSEEKYDSDVSYTPSIAGSSFDSSPSKPSSQSTVDSYLKGKIKKDEQVNLQCTLSLIRQKPRLYIGVPKNLFFLIEMISNKTNLLENHIFLCLMKIRTNRTFSELADAFDISLPQASKIFVNKMPTIVSVLSPFVQTFTTCTIKKNLPIAFRHKYNKVNCIIDCLEIEIQKPKKALHQALTWSEYKKANTMKYLIACTPDGLVTFVSSGYGGRISDVNLLEDSKFLDSLQPNSCILADRGFKHIEVYLSQRGFALLRPPSVPAGTKLTKQEVKQTKEIASLRIHVERVIRRIREFSMLKPHSVVNLNLLSVLDFCVTTACALINLQDSLIQ